MAAARMPIARTLTRLNMLVSTSALLIACGGFIVYDLATFREATMRNLSIQAEIAGSSSTSALVFNDTQTATETVAALAGASDVLIARILDDAGNPFAEYRRSGAAVDHAVPVIPPGEFEVFELDADAVSVARRILFDGSQVGTIYVRSGLQPLYVRLRSYALIAGTVMLGSAITALIVSQFTRRRLAAPIAHIADVAHRVAVDGDYTARAEVGAAAPREIETMAHGFNEMLARIQERDRALAESREQLEERVRSRTDELNVAYKDLEAFSYSVSHDLRAPLRHVTGFATLLRNHLGESLDDRGRRYLDTLTGAATRMGRLIDDLLSFSRMGRASLSPRQVDLAQVVKEAQAEIMPETAGREIVWDIHRLPSVYADPALLRPAIINLLSNAVKYTSTRDVAHIEVGSSRTETGEVVVFVRDNGVGFDMQYADKLFGVFQRLHRSEEFSGTGIGLASVRRIINRHGGRTWAHGEVDHGATFYFSLPEPAA